MTVFTKRAVDVGNPVDGSGNARGMNMGEFQTWGAEVENALAEAGALDEVVLDEENETIVVEPGTSVLFIRRVAPTATTVNLPAIAAQGSVGLRIVDLSTSVVEHVITINPDGDEKIMTKDSWPIVSNASQLASAQLRPSSLIDGWYTAP